MVENREIGNSEDWTRKNFEQGWQKFPIGTRVEVRIRKNKKMGDIWCKGTVVETPKENERAIVVKCDKKWHKNKKFYGGHGATVPVYMNTRRRIIANIRKINESRFVLVAV